MSIERELLQAIILKVDGLEGIGLMPIIKECKELLAQPEQEPIFKVIEKNKFNEGLKVGQESGYRAILEAAQAKQSYLDENERLTTLLLSAEDKIQELDSKREPLSEYEIVALWANKSPANEFECVRLVEKARGIGGGE